MDEHADSDPVPDAPRRLTFDAVALGDTARAWLRWIGPRRVLAAAGTLLVLGGVVWWLVRAPSPPTEARLPQAERAAVTSVPESASIPDAATTMATAPLTTAAVVVHVAGAVAAPGVYELQPGARVADAIAAAGGATGDADPDVLNLAAPVTDGDRIAVPVAGAVEPTSAGHTHASPMASENAPSVPVNINEAGVAELETLPGVGPATAAAIVEHRERNGPFGSVDDLEHVRGIGPAKLDALRDHVTV